MNVTRVRNRLLLATTLTLCSGVALATDWSHQPDDDIGPGSWGLLDPTFATCGNVIDEALLQVGKKQSPIDIVTVDTTPTAVQPLLFRYQPTEGIVENTGHVVEVPYRPGSFLRVGQYAYDFLQFHFHAPSEHTINGEAADAEVHLVHRNALLDLAVVGVLIKIGSPINELADQALRSASLESGEEIDLGTAINARSLVPRPAGYYHYSGSLTTPPCSEGVRWFVMKEPIFVSAQAIDHLRTVIGEFTNYTEENNNRPLMPLNGRAVVNSRLR